MVNTLLSPPQFVCLVRLCTMLTAFFSFHKQPFVSLGLIILAESLDMLDGYLARKLKQVSAFGTIADMLIDRLTPIFCFTMLISLAPKWSAELSLLLALDILAHMAMIYSALLIGTLENHKKLFININPILNLYYAPNGIKRCFMVLNIVFYDLALLSWLIYFIAPNLLPQALLFIFTLLGSIKIYVHILHLYYSFKLSL